MSVQEKKEDTIGFTLNPTILGICLAVIPCLLETLYLGKCGKSQRISVYVLGLLIPSIVEKVALYLIGVAHEFFLKNFFKNFSARLPKRMVQTVVVAKGEENRITRLCGREGR